MVKSFRLTRGSNHGPSDCKPSTLPLEQNANSMYRWKTRLAFWLLLISTTGANTLNIVDKNIYFLCKSKYFPISLPRSFRIFWSLPKKLAFLRKRLFHSIGLRTRIATYEAKCVITLNKNIIITRFWLHYVGQKMFGDLVWESRRKRLAPWSNG